MEFLDKIISLGGPVFDVIKIVATVLSLVFGGLTFYLFTQVRSLERKLLRAEDEADAAKEALVHAGAERDVAVARVADLVRIIDDEEELWTRKPIVQPKDFLKRKHESIPVLLMANLKGGVGKTTLSANLAGYFDARGERVLLIDLDYQGSLSSMAIEGGIPNPKHPGAVALLEGREPHDRHDLVGRKNPSKVIDCYYPFFNAENRLLIRWLLDEEREPADGRPPPISDARFRLADYILGSRIQTTFDRVIIDTGPRVTLGMVNGLAAATHIVVPTQLNELSAQAANSFVFTAGKISAALGLGVSAYRVVGVQKANDLGKKLLNVEEQAIALIHELVANNQKIPGAFVEDAMVPNKTAFAAHAGVKIAYGESPIARAAIDPLGGEIAKFAPAVSREDVL